MKSIRCTVSLFLIGLFILPLAVEGIHGWHHHEEAHCTETNTNHLHSVQHQCKICDVFPPAVYSIPIEEITNIQQLIPSHNPVQAQRIIFHHSILPQYLRGPPNLS